MTSLRSFAANTAALLLVTGAAFAQSPSGTGGAPAAPAAPAATTPQPGTPGGATPGHGHGHDHAHGPRGQGPDGMRQGMMRHLDTDRDGAISKTEVEAAHQRHLQMFDRADANRDGKLTREEMQAFGRSMQQQRRGGPGGTPGAAPAAPLGDAPRG